MLTAEHKEGLGVALNEADFLGLEVSADDRVAAATFSVLTLPEQGPAPADRRVQFLFWPVGRVAASLRLGHWDDKKAPVVSFKLDQLLPIVQEFGGQPIYGWKFFDTHYQDFRKWSKRLSLDCYWKPDGLSHTITLFQEGPNKHLDICLWFDEFQIRDPQGNEIAIDDFIAGGVRWWDAMYSGDKRTSGVGIAPLGTDINSILPES